MNGKTIYYAIKIGDEYMQGIEPNENYCRSGTAPTMGARYSYSEFKSIWGYDIKLNILDTTELLTWLQDSMLDNSCDVIFIATDKLLENAKVDDELKMNLFLIFNYLN